ncbi:MAG: quinolinate synthase NadA [Bacteroidales bacterium]|jgi:quinolinate synthase|nr:quinolinate synthase NadA [Bacteroidales bacterium]MDX9926633.1 quinolinate synthase NadA [Bacteroidales bacterium]HNX84120.1 quinolinate synthase NadA [Bacteroidales bacterium]HOC47208.1 quinolinate synthase NadA [Bacteroidales bacterium]HPS97022.1 quinolinate synthase NadA [Bacteroidales bacterium]
MVVDNNRIKEIEALKKEKNAVILAHYYQTSDIQDIADFIGDSLALSQKAAETKADIIVFAGVKFMAETAKILSPEKKVIIPDLMAGCSLADSCKKEDFEKFISDNPGRTVITYVNTTADIKALSDIACTSSNAKQIIESLPPDEKIIFGPDRNLGNYIKSLTGRDILVWDGACHVHEQFSLEAILKLKNENPGSKIIAHPECEKPVRLVADYIGSTSGLLSFISKDPGKIFIVATEPGILYQMKKAEPEKILIPAPPKDSTCGCSECNFMKLITLEKIYKSLKFEEPEVTVDPSIIERAAVPIKRMLEMSAKLGL